MAIAGGFVMEDDIYKGLALGAPYVDFIGIGRGAMAAAMAGEKIGNLIKDGKVPRQYEKFGSTIKEIFGDIGQLKEIYGEEAVNISPGAIGLYSYINRVSAGVQQFMALNRKFALKHIERSDIFPLTNIGAEVTGLKTYNELLDGILEDFEY